ncbi:MAG: hypothetical protein LBT14_09415 [Treponema sp.]|jgi:hypothetical protein|nr:hypothetical protein [Treponema sp.]
MDHQRAVSLSPREARSEERKNRAIESLSVQFSRNSLPLEEYERLVEYIHRVESERELAIVEKIVDETARYAGYEQRTSREAPAAINPEGKVQRKVSFLANREISGLVLSKSRCSFLAFLGNNSINIQEGDLPPGRTEVEVVSVLGLTIINVPANVRVIVEATPLAGGIFVEGAGTSMVAGETRGGPELVITGGAYFGNITIRVGNPEQHDWRQHQHGHGHRYL